jgi:hypothetical protein
VSTSAFGALTRRLFGLLAAGAAALEGAAIGGSRPEDAAADRRRRAFARRCADALAGMGGVFLGGPTEAAEPRATPPAAPDAPGSLAAAVRDEVAAFSRTALAHAAALALSSLSSADAAAGGGAAAAGAPSASEQKGGDGGGLATSAVYPPAALVIDAVYCAQTLAALLVLPRGVSLVGGGGAAGGAHAAAPATPPARRATAETLPAVRVAFRVAIAATQSSSPLVRHVVAALARAAGDCAFDCGK